MVMACRLTVALWTFAMIFNKCCAILKDETINSVDNIEERYSYVNDGGSPYNDPLDCSFVQLSSVDSDPLGCSMNIDTDPLGCSTNIDIDPLGCSTDIDIDPLGCSTNIDSDPLGCSTNIDCDPLGCSTNIDSDPLGCSMNIDSDPLGCSTNIDSDPLGCSTNIDSDPLGCSTNIDSDPLGCSTNIDSDPLGCSTNIDSDPLGCSSASSVSIEQDLSNDPLGISLLEACDGLEHSNLENIAHSFQLTSTPRKSSLPPFEDFMDVEEFSTVLATPLIRNTQKDCFLTPPKTSSKLLKKALHRKNIMESIQTSCHCPQDCMDKVTYVLAYRTRFEYWNRNREQKSLWLISKLKFSQKCGRFTYMFVDNGQGLCLRAIGKVLMLNKNAFTKHRILLGQDVYSVFSPVREYSEKTVNCIAWIENYASMFGDRMPHTKDILLPYKTIKRHVYFTYKAEMENYGYVSEPTFYAVWAKNFPNLKVKKASSFAICEKCDQLQRKLQKATCKEDRSRIRQERNLHYQRQMLERKYYYAKRQASKQHPDEFLSLIVDGMDQSKTDLPHFSGRLSKNINKAALLKTHVTGVISHGHGMFTSYLDILDYPHDPNLTINVLIKVLFKIADNQGVLPPILYLQADNCGRDNKNRYVLFFLELLVRLKIFQEVHLSFLYVGHTHEDIDAGFSKISEKLHKNDAETIPELIALINNCEKLEDMLDVKNWLKDSICKINHISEPLHFKIVQAKTKNPKFYYKGQQHTAWRLLDGRGTFLRDIPSGKPKVLKKDFTKIDDKLISLKKQISAIQCMFSSKENFEWWQTFFNNFKKKPSGHQQWITCLPCQRKTKSLKQVKDVLDTRTRSILDKEVRTPRLSCEKRKGLKKSYSKKKMGESNFTKGKKTQHRRISENPRSKVKLTYPGSKKKSTSTGPTNPTKEKKKIQNRQVLSKLVMIPMTDETKRHLWIMLFLDMFLSLIVLYMCILHSLFTLWALLLTLESAWTLIIIEHCAMMKAIAHTVGTFAIQLQVQNLSQPHQFMLV